MLYILNWVYRANYEMGYVHHPVVYLAGLVQTLLYADFFYYYAIRYSGLPDVRESVIRENGVYLLRNAPGIWGRTSRDETRIVAGVGKG